MKKLMIAMAALAAAAQVLAMPTRADLSKAQPLVAELMAPTMGEYKSAADKVAAAVSVGDRSCAFADEAETEAVKFILLKGAVSYYVRGEAYDKAADCVAKMQSEIKDLTPDAVAEIVGRATSRISESKAPRLLAYYRAAKLQIRARNEIPSIEQKLKRDKSDQLQRRYAEALAISGNWKAAYDAFAKSGNANLAQIAEAEAKGTAANEQAAELWWNYTPEFEGVGDFFKVHAVEFYQKALEKGEISGLKKTIVERRIAQFSKEAATPAKGGVTSVASGKTPSNALYCVIDLSAGPIANKYPVKWLAVPPAGGFNTDEYKTTKLVLRRVESGTFKMMDAVNVTITKSFYITESVVTEQQFKQVTGNDPSAISDKGAASVSWDTVRGKSDVYNWPTVKMVDPTSFIGIIRERTGFIFDLPTEAQWEYSIRSHRLSVDEFHHEWCLDWWTGTQFLPNGAVDPEGPDESRLYKGGSRQAERVIRISEKARAFARPDQGTFMYKGKRYRVFRLCMNPEVPVGVSARGSSTPVASGMAPDSAPAKRGKSIVVKIKNGIELEFISCPAGTFTQGATKTIYPVSGKIYTPDRDGLTYKHEVVITRPFWMSKYPITVEQFGAFCAVDKAFENKNGKQSGSKMPVCLCVEAAEDYCKWLNRRFASALPGYCIFRLPTDAEWEYALFANSTDTNDPYVRFRDGERLALQEICGTNLPVPVGTVGKPNAWGLYDMLGNGCHYVLDTISSEKFRAHDDCYGHISNNLRCGYKESEIDPLHWYVPNDKGTTARHLMRGGCYLSWAKIPGPSVYYRMVECGDVSHDNGRSDRPRIWTFRVVIGPDLVSEWMAKNGKK